MLLEPHTTVEAAPITLELVSRQSGKTTRAVARAFYEATNRPVTYLVVNESMTAEIDRCLRSINAPEITKNITVTTYRRYSGRPQYWFPNSYTICDEFDMAPSSDVPMRADYYTTSVMRARTMEMYQRVISGEIRDPVIELLIRTGWRYIGHQTAQLT